MKPSDARDRQDRMARLYGPGDGSECRHCVSLVHAPTAAQKNRHVCVAAGNVVWLLHWQSCGAKRVAANYDDKQVGR